MEREKIAGILNEEQIELKERGDGMVKIEKEKYDWVWLKGWRRKEVRANIEREGCIRDW